MNPYSSTRFPGLGRTLISTDFPGPTMGLEYFVTIPGGQPSRCNPLTAPPDCTPADIEALAGP